jgi:hypothetical protein
MEENTTSELRVDGIVRLKHDLEKSMWNKKIFLKVIETAAFAGMFLCSNPLGFQVSVVIAAIAILIDVYLSYSSWKDEWSFKLMTI